MAESVNFRVEWRTEFLVGVCLSDSPFVELAKVVRTHGCGTHIVSFASRVSRSPHLNEDWNTSTRRLSISRTRLIFYQCEYTIKALQVEVGTVTNRTNNTFSLSDLFTLAAGKHHEATWAPLAGTARLFPP